jgi:hypothetical protein
MSIGHRSLIFARASPLGPMPQRLAAALARKPVLASPPYASESFYSNITNLNDALTRLQSGPAIRRSARRHENGQSGTEPRSIRNVRTRGMVRRRTRRTGNRPKPHCCRI